MLKGTGNQIVELQVTSVLMVFPLTSVALDVSHCMDAHGNSVLISGGDAPHYHLDCTPLSPVHHSTVMLISRLPSKRPVSENKKKTLGNVHAHT